jgi:fibronectin type 3 domain-containing protein
VLQLTQISVSTAGLNFGNIPVGTTSTLQVTFANTGSSDVQLSQQAVNGGAFSSAGIGSNVVLTANQSATLNVTFDPSSAGNATGSVVLSSNDTTQPIVIALTGAGTQSAHSVTLNWDASTSDVVGYNVYRGASSDGPWTDLSGSAGAGLSYTDSSVQAGQLYFYAVTAIGSDYIESLLSNTVSAVIPSP